MSKQYDLIIEFVNEVEQMGCTHFFVCPGSRNAPIVHALLNSSNAVLFSQLDERCAGYHALGLAKRLQKPVAIVCTSGTAALNLAPAMAEAYYQGIPIIAITADRPIDSTNSFENQAILQTNIFSNFIGAEIGINLAVEKGSQFNFLVSQSLNSITINKPVHINIHLDEPLYEFSDTDLMVQTNQPINADFPNDFQIAKTDIPDRVLNNIKTFDRTLVVLGFSTQPVEITHLNHIMITDTCSANYKNGNVHFFEFYIDALSEDEGGALRPDLLITNGTFLLSKRLKNWLKTNKPKYHLHIGDAPEYKSPYCEDFDVINCSLDQILAHLSLSEEYQNQWLENETNWSLVTKNRFRKMKSPFHEILFSLLSQAERPALHCGNSMSVRYASLFQALHGGFEHLICNRGTSGIDGCLSTFLGYASKTPTKPWLLIGDLSFFYDSNAFWLNELPEEFIVLIINNRKGQIFNAIDGPDQFKKGKSYITTPHNYSAFQTAKMHEIDYYPVKDKADAAALNMNHISRAIIELFDDDPNTIRDYKSLFAQA